MGALELTYLSLCVCQRKTKERKWFLVPSTGFEPVPLGYALIVLPITPRR